MRLALTAAVLAALTSASAAEPAISAIEAKLFYERSGTLSDNVAEPSGVTLWNTVIGEGESGGPANDVLIVVTVKAEPDSYLDAPLAIRVTGAAGKTVATRTVEGLLIGSDGVISKGVYLQDSTCNALTVKATIGKSTKETKVPFACGE